ncbi:SCAPER domain-containing protein short spindle 3 isoform X2 [Oratosquilla oratoria]|uniref:SCAPER domain-containing protein short spindle 3 isoform X2 n=1 Tax=Oratosquilla oratoria TaxID=337810 RepID=UPI003F7772A0
MKGDTAECPPQSSQQEVVERVKARLLEEGREARNLIAYSLPLQDPHPLSSGRRTHTQCVTETPTRRNSKQDKRPRSASAGRDPQSSLRARHWGFLFRNLQQAVDEIYKTCEDDESIVECKEAILMMERYTSDFKKLIEWLKIKWEYEHTPPPQRPNSLAWEIRTSSPGKPLFHERRILSVSDAKRVLNFECKPDRILTVTNGMFSKETVVQTSLKEETCPETIEDVTSMIESLKDEAVADVDGKKYVSKEDGKKCTSRHAEGENKKTAIKPIVEEPTHDKPVIVVHQVEKVVTAEEETTEIENIESAVDRETESDNQEEETGKEGKSGNEGEELESEKDASEKGETGKKEECETSLTSEEVVTTGKFESETIEKGECRKSESTDGGKVEKAMGVKLERGVSRLDAKERLSSPKLKLILTKDKEVPNKCASSTSEAVREGRNTQEAIKSTGTGSSASANSAKEALGDPSSTNSSGSKGKELGASQKHSDLSPRCAESKNGNEMKQTEETSRKSCAEVLQSRAPPSKPGPTVNMNKASQVRQAYNQQNKTPQKQKGLGISSRATSATRVTDSKTSLGKGQGSGSKLKRVVETKPSSSPPQLRRHDVKYGRGQTATTAGVNGVTRSHSTLGMGRGLLRTSSNLTENQAGKTNATHVGLNNGNREKTSSNSSLASSASSGLSWADKVRGVTHSHQSSQQSLQDDGEGWEVVRRGRRSHGGSTVSLNRSSTSSFSEPSRKSSGRSSGHAGSGPKSRFHVPSSAMSMPSLAITDSHTTKASTTTPSPKERHVKMNSSNSFSFSRGYSAGNITEKDSTSSRGYSRRKARSYSQSSVNDKKGSLQSRGLGEDFQQNRVSESKVKLKCKVASKNRKNSHGLAEEENKCVQSNSDSGLDRRKLGKIESVDKGEEHQKNNKLCEDIDKLCLNETVNDIKSESGLEDLECFEENSRGSHEILPLSIVETSENSEVEDDDRKSSSKIIVGNLMKGDDEGTLQDSGTYSDIQESDYLQADKDSKNYDSDSGMDEEEMRHNAAALESAVQEEQRLKQQIEEAEKAEIKMEEEDEDDGDEAALEGNSEEPGPRVTSPLTPQFDSLIASLSWADQVEAYESLEELRHPGRVLHIHEKLSSPSRKRSLSEKVRRHEEKLAKAQELRGKLMLAKTDKLKDLFKRIEEVRQDKERLQDEKRDLLRRKMQRAEEKRKRHLQDIINKAHDEENKAKEIAFINGLEAQNKWHDIMQQHQSLESRLADMAEERTRKQEEKAAKEAAAQERRKALEAERQARMAELCEKRRRKCERIDRQQAERREELLEQAREKARDREERLTALQQAQQAKESELVKKIQQKQEETARRHEENIESIRQKALESSIMKFSGGCDDAPRLMRYETKKLCTLCNSLILSEVYLLSHLRGRKHQDALATLHQGQVSSEESATYNLRHIVDAPANIDDPQVTRDKERQKALKKRCRKIRSRMTTRGKDYNNEYKPAKVNGDSSSKNRIQKALQQVTKLLDNQGTGPWPVGDVASLDKVLLELMRILEKRVEADQLAFSALDGFTKLSSVLKIIVESKENQPCVIPAKSLGYCGRAFLAACKGNAGNCRHVLYSNLVGMLVDYLIHRLNEMVIETTRGGSNSSINTIVSLPSDSASSAIFAILAEVVEVVGEHDVGTFASCNSEDKKKDNADSSWQRLQDLISYCVSVGVVDKVSWFFSHVQGPIEGDQSVVEMIMSAMTFLASLTKTLGIRSPSDDPTQLIGTLHVTEAVGVVSLLYGLLLHQGAPSRSAALVPPQLSSPTHSLTLAGTTMLYNMALLDLNMFQAVLGGEGISLELRHIASYLIWYSSHWTSETLLHNVITLVGFFTINNRENQMVMQSGEMPSVLQQLCNLPWPYFSEPRLSSVLFPTLLACCLNNPDNMQILQQEMSFQVLEDFLKDNKDSDKALVQILLESGV